MSKPATQSGAVIKVSADATPAEQIKTMDAILANPLTLLPLEWRPTVMGFWMRWTHCIKDGMLTLCMRVNDYRQEGLTLQELRGVFGRVNKSEREKPIEYGALGLFAAIAGQVNSVLRSTKAIKAAAKAKEKDESDAANRFVGRLADSFPKMPKV